jgi:hypothetical protein
MGLEVENCLIIMNNTMDEIDYFEAALFASVFHLNADDFRGFPIENELDPI